MATERLLGEFCEETTCSICLEYFKDPVILDCGHNFCQACLTQCGAESGTGACCPQCREVFQQKNFRPNRQLANLVELVKKLEVGKRAMGRKWEVCEQHQEALKLFCKEDQTRICWLCDRSKEHKEHNTVLLDEAVQEYKERIKAQQGSLEKERNNLVVWKLAEEWESQECLTQVRTMVRETKRTFEQMRRFLEEKECLRLSQLRDLEKEMEDRHEEHVRRLSEDISHLCSLIAEMEGKCQQPADEFLQDIKSTWSRYVVLSELLLVSSI
ncbi:PREDICTED: zinc finger protein RFP-like [Gekko japonicus]|uniref:RING-type E3 ubiquitin transferase n=1 Tax=Gekko japonicus TaxID=146911 RepID=A0ABM1KZH3_GEKJA|nr:PREDICTED: zinc finger protein RFP-like [Gekko japonicus]